MDDQPDRSGAAEPGGTYQIRALTRGLALLSCFRARSGDRSLSELAAQTGLDKSTALRLLTRLVDAGYLTRDREQRRYRIGPAVLELANAFQTSTPLAVIARDHLRTLAERTGQTAQLAVLRDGDAMNVAVAFANRTLRQVTYVGDRQPVHCASTGKAMVAHLHRDELDAIVATYGLPRRTQRTIVAPAAFAEELSRVRERGYAVDDEEAIEGVRCVGAVVRDYTGRPVAGVSVSGAAGEFVSDAFVRYVEAVQHAATAISAELGFVAASVAVA